MSGGVFEDLAAFDNGARIASRKAVAVAHKRVDDYVGKFLRQAHSADEHAARLALVDEDLTRIVSEVVEEYGGDAEHIAATIREVVADCPEHLKEHQFKKKDKKDDSSGANPDSFAPSKGDDDEDDDSDDGEGDGDGDAGSATASVRQADAPLGEDPNQPTRSFPCANCGTNIDRYRGMDDIDCPNCGAAHNSFGQRLAPKSQWGEETGESLSDIYGPDPESLGYPYEAKTASPESINVEPNWENMRAWVLNMAKTDPQAAQKIAEAMGREAPPELMGQQPGGQDMENPYPHNEPSPGIEMGGEAGPYQAKVARRPKMCPYHSELVDASLQAGDPQYAAFSNLVGSPSHCKGGFEGSCNFKPEMVTQSYWDDKKNEYAERKQQRELDRERDLSQPVNPIPEPDTPPVAEEGEGITDINTELEEAPSAVGSPVEEPVLAKTAEYPEDEGYGRYDPYEDGDDRSMFADPGGNSALRAEGPGNPRNLPCPNCGTENVLTPADRARGYQCDRCADAAEGLGGFAGSKTADADKDGGGAVTTEKLPKGNEDALGGPSPKTDHKTWKPNALNDSGNIKPIDSEQSNSPVPTDQQDVTDEADHKKDFEEQTQPVNEEQTLPTADESGQSTERNVSGQDSQSDTWHTTDGLADPVTNEKAEGVLSSADPDKNPIREILNRDFVDNSQVEAAIREWEAEKE